MARRSARNEWMFGQLQHPMTLWKQALALGLFVLLFAALTGPAATVAETKEYTSAGTAFGFKLLHQLSKQEPGKNIMFSPYSAYTLLEMVCCGSAGKTAEEMKRVLGLEDVSIDSVGPRNRLLSNENKRNGKGVDLSIANSLWYRKGITLKPEFLRASTDFFQATVEALDFNDTSAAGIINSWSSRSTHGRIGQVVVGPFSSMTGMYLANAVYFKGTWARKFDEQLTHDGIFHLRDGKQKQVRMMAFGYKAPLSYQKGAGFQAVRLPYGSEDVAMTIFLPGQSSTVEELLSWLGSGGSQDATFDSYSHAEVWFGVPRFKLDCGVDLKPPLVALGMRSAFEEADFSGVSTEPLDISAIAQKCLVEVNEEGTEASVVSDAWWMKRGGPPPEVTMVVDRPFLFMIQNIRTRTTLFMGLVYDPGAT